MDEIVKTRIEESILLKKKLIKNDAIEEQVLKIANEIVGTYKRGGKLIICGNGGSASDALHFAGELVGRFKKERKSYPAVVLNADVATMTAISNDYGYEEVFARQIEGFGNKGDLFVGISTSGNSTNIYKAVDRANGLGLVTVALLGGNGGKIGKIANYPIIVPSTDTARIQECHICLIHILCELIENDMELYI